MMQSLYLQRIMKKSAAKGYEKTKPKQTQLPKSPKMNVNTFSQKDYENETAFRPRKNKPKQTQSQNPTIKACLEPCLKGGRINHKLPLKLI